MSNQRSTQVSQQAASLIASGWFLIDDSLHQSGMGRRRGTGGALSDEILAGHLVDVALLARDERDFRLAEHLVDVAYTLASGERTGTLLRQPCTAQPGGQSFTVLGAPKR